MEITNELLAAYVENKVPDAERIQIREYLVNHPEELESLIIMMDEDYDLSLPSDEICCEESCIESLISFHSINRNFTLPLYRKPIETNDIVDDKKKGINDMLSELLDSL